MDCSLPGSSVHRIFQARVLEWGAIAFIVIREDLKKKTKLLRYIRTVEPRGGWDKVGRKQGRLPGFCFFNFLPVK